MAELLALSEGVLDSLPLDRIATFKARLPSWLDARVPAALNRIEKTGELDEDSRSALARRAARPRRHAGTVGSRRGRRGEVNAMSERLGDVKNRLHSIRELHGVVDTMRAMAAAGTQQAQQALEGIRRHADVVGAALAEATGLLSPDEPIPSAQPRGTAKGVLLFTSEHGFAGGFDTPLLDEAQTSGKDGNTLLFVVGERGAMAARERGLDMAWSIAMASQPGAVMTTARRVTDEIYRRYGTGELAALDMLYARYDGGGRSTVTRQSLLPVDFNLFPPPVHPARPLTNLAPATLVMRLVEEYVFSAIARAAMESFASENAARMVAMQSASRNIEEKIAELEQTARQLRQDEITTEMLDVVTGAQALSWTGL